MIHSVIRIRKQYAGGNTFTVVYVTAFYDIIIIVTTKITETHFFSKRSGYEFTLN